MQTHFNKWSGVFAALLGAALCSGCEPYVSSTACTTEARAALNINVVDSTSNTPPASVSLVRVSEGTYVEDLQNGYVSNNALRFAGAYERKGNYALLVRANGYQDYTATNIRITAGACHVNAQQIDVKLQRTP